MSATLPSVDHLRLLLDQVDQRAKYQREEWDGLDRKATTMLATTGVLLGLVAGHAPAQGAPHLVVVGFGLAVAALVLALLAGAAALWPREFRVVPEPQALVDTYAGMATDMTLGVLVSTKAKYFAENRGALKVKLRLLRAQVALVVAAGALLAAVLVSTEVM